MVTYKMKVQDYEDSFNAYFTIKENDSNAVLDLIELAIKRAGSSLRFQPDYRDFDEKKNEILNMKFNDKIKIIIGEDYGEHYTLKVVKEKSKLNKLVIL